MSARIARLHQSYAIGRLAFGAGALIAPKPSARLLLGPAGEEPAPRTLMANFGTRDVLLGAGLLHALRDRGPTRPWVVAGFAADVLDTVVQLREWQDLPAGRRAAGVGSAVAAAAVGAGLLAYSR